MPALRMVASGLTTPLPAISGAEPWTGSNIEGKRRRGSRLALAARPMLPTRIAEMSLRISAEQIGAHHHVEALRPADEIHRGGIHQQRLGLDLRKFRRHFVEGAVPEHHAVALRVGFGDRGDALLLVALHRQIEGEAHDALDAAAGKDGGLDGDLFGLMLVDEAADLGVLAFGVLAHHDEIDIAALGPRQRRSTPG